MKQIVIYWEGPFKYTDSIPYHLRGVPGIYIIECDSEIMYIGKSETNGAFKRAKDHFRGQGDSTGRRIIERKDKSKIMLWIGFIELYEDIFLTERYMIYKLKPNANLNHIKKYENVPLKIINEGKLPINIKGKIHDACNRKV